MKITSVRHGFATNSSSSHSVVHGIPNWSGLTKREIADNYNPKIGTTEFGWEFETHDDFNSIVTYAIMANLVFDYSFVPYGETFNTSKWEFEILSRGYSEELTDILLKHGEYLINEAYVDHQSFLGGGTEDSVWDFIYGVTSVETGNDNV